jgi:hypothetical protein
MNNDEKIQIRQFRYFSDNFGYLVFGEKTAMAIDGGAAEKILDFVREDEKKVDLFLRFNDEKIVSLLRARGLPAGSEPERWQSLMSLM